VRPSGQEPRRAARLPSGTKPVGCRPGTPRDPVGGFAAPDPQAVPPPARAPLRRSFCRRTHFCACILSPAKTPPTGRDERRRTRATYTKRKSPCVGACFAPVRPCKGRSKGRPGCYSLCPPFRDCGAFVEKFIRAYSHFGNVVLPLGNSDKQEFGHDSSAYIRRCSADTRD